MDLLTKPVDQEELLLVIERNLGQARGRNVLVVEDDLGTQELLRSSLEGAGVHVTLAGNGEEAEEALKSGDPDLILLDLVMPVMDGTAFLQRLRTDLGRTDIPVIICTGKALSPEERRRLWGQATRIIDKGEGFETDLVAALADYFPVRAGNRGNRGSG